MGPCLCGDLRCGSCGPAQGNSKCIICGKWADEGGCTDPKKCEEELIKFEEAWAKQEEEWSRMEANLDLY